MSQARAPLAGLRIIESSLLGPAAITHHLADMGADVIKVEGPGGDYIRRMTWPIIEGDSLLHLHINRGKKSVVLNLKTEEAKDVYRDLVRDADVVVEAMRPGALARMGLGFDDLKKINPKIVFCSISGYGATGPYKTYPSHGIAYDTWAGIVEPTYDDQGFCRIPSHVSLGINAGPMFGALGILAAVIRARETGEGSMLEVAQSDSAAYMDWYRSETEMAYRRPQSEVTGNAADDYERRPAGPAGMWEGVRYQLYETKGGEHVLFMASEQAFWKNFCEALDRMDLFEKWPGAKVADHARGNLELQAILRDIFKTKTAKEWLAFGDQYNTPLAPVNTPKNIVDDPQFQHRLPLYPHEKHGADMLPYPVKFQDEELPAPERSATPGQHTSTILRDVLGYDDAKVEALEKSGALG